MRSNVRTRAGSSSPLTSLESKQIFANGPANERVWSGPLQGTAEHEDGNLGEGFFLDILRARFSEDEPTSS